MEAMPLEKEGLLDRRTNTIMIWVLLLSPITIGLLVAFAVFVLSDKPIKY